jgi:hypothetical protein
MDSFVLENLYGTVHSYIGFGVCFMGILENHCAGQSGSHGNNTSDTNLIDVIVEELVNSFGDQCRLQSVISFLISESINRVIDNSRTNRRDASELSKVERLYLATRIKQVFLGAFPFHQRLPGGMQIGGFEVGVVSALRPRFSIPANRHGFAHIVIITNLTNNVFSVGVKIPHEGLIQRPRASAGSPTKSVMMRWVCRGVPICEFPKLKKGPGLATNGHHGLNHLPPDPEEMNDARAEWAKSTITFFEQYGESPHKDATKMGINVLARQNLSDLIADFGHYCDREGYHLNSLIRIAAECYLEETEGKGVQFLG